MLKGTIKSSIAAPGQTEIIANNLDSAARNFIGKYFLVILAVTGSLTAIYFLLSPNNITFLKDVLNKDNHLFYWMVLAGFFAEMVAGSMGMGYGVICTSLLLILNVPPPFISASIHSAESFTSATGAISHYKLGNINMKLFKRLAIPAVAGAILGAISLTYLGEKYAAYTKPIMASYTLYLGIKILRNAFTKKNADGTILITKKKTNIPVIGIIGGFIDSFGGGGWGPLVTGTLIKNGRTPCYVIGSSTAAKCLLTVASAVTFVFSIGIQHWNIVAGLLIGGIVTAPFSAMLTAKLPVRKMFIAVGFVIIICSLITFYRALFL
jgi:uncharacterized membrane protein YfcA